MGGLNFVNFSEISVDMEGQTANLDKAKAAANAICAEQYKNGEFSTRGRDYKTGESMRDKRTVPRIGTTQTFVPIGRTINWRCMSRR